VRSLSDKKVSVDDALISTDVDRLIRTIAEAGKVPLSELRAQSRIDKRTLDKWLVVLEEEGYINIEYKLGATLIHWLGPEQEENGHEEASEAPEHEENEPEPEARDEPIEPEPLPEEVEADAEDSISLVEEELGDRREMRDEVEEEDLTPLVEDDLMQEQDHDSLKSNILSNLEDDEPEEESSDEASLPEEDAPEAQERPDDDPEPEDEPDPDPGDEEPSEEPEPEEEPEPVQNRGEPYPGEEHGPRDEGDEEPLQGSEEETSEDSGGPVPIGAVSGHDEEERPSEDAGDSDHEQEDDMTEPLDSFLDDEHETPLPISSQEEESGKEKRAFSDVRPLFGSTKPESYHSSSASDVLNTYLDQINKEKAAIESLRNQKKALYREKFAGLESRMEADLVSLTEMVIEKQSRINELKERFLDLPDKLDEVEELHAHLRKIREEGRSSLTEAKAQAQASIAGIQKARSALSSKIERLRDDLDKEEGRVQTLERMREEGEERIDALNQAQRQMRERMESLEEAMGALRDSLDQAETAKADIDAISQEVKTSVEQSGSELQSLIAQLDQMTKVEGWINDYVSDYEKRIAEVDDYVASSEDEIADLRSSAEAKYLSRYLRELESLATEYQGALDQTVEEERAIDQAIDKSKSRIMELVSESRDLVRKVGQGAKGYRSYEDVRAEMAARNASIKQMVEEKSEERSSMKGALASTPAAPVRKKAKVRRKKAKTAPRKAAKPSKGKKAAKGAKKTKGRAKK